jgi:2-polyprenyl-6-methoxyphenol hydroxylase-like FAD-dependent oxidoreductase
MTDSKIIICGGGPAGLLQAILFADLGVATTVIEKAKEPDQW